MLPPPTSRQSSFAYTLPRQPSHSNRRMPSFAPSHVDTELDEDEEDDDEAEERLAIQEEMGLNEGRGLEETLEKLGFGLSSF